MKKRIIVKQNKTNIAYRFEGEIEVYYTNTDEYNLYKLYSSVFYNGDSVKDKLKSFASLSKKYYYNLGYKEGFENGYNEGYNEPEDNYGYY